MRALILIAALSLVARVASAEPGQLAHPRIERRPSLFGPRYFYEDRDVTPGRELRLVFRETKSIESERMLERSESTFIVANAIGIPGAIIGGLGLGSRSAPAAILGTAAMVIGFVFAAQANQQKVAAIASFNAAAE